MGSVIKVQALCFLSRQQKHHSWAAQQIRRTMAADNGWKN
jgi:hypothetical protein